MNKNYNRTTSHRGEIRKEKTNQGENHMLPGSNREQIEVNSQLFQIDPRLLQRFSFDDNGGGYKGL